jgi:molybdopterin synthase sulfur carrier subunit
MKTIHLLYFAFLREQAGTSSETIRTEAATILDLYHELSARHPFTLPAASLRAAIDNTYTPLSTPLTDNTTIALIPPVSGG